MKRLTTKQAAFVLGRTPLTLWLWRRAGEGPPWEKVMGRYFYYQEQIEAWRLATIVRAEQRPARKPDTAQLTLPFVFRVMRSAQAKLCLYFESVTQSPVSAITPMQARFSPVGVSSQSNFKPASPLKCAGRFLLREFVALKVCCAESLLRG